MNPNEADQVDGSTTAPSVPELAIEIQELDPTASPSEIARACLLITNTLDQLQTDSSEYVLVELWQAAVMKLQLAADQHEAMITELKELAQSNPEDFTKQQIWILLRAIKVQSQVLQIYTGSPSLDV